MFEEFEKEEEREERESRIRLIRDSAIVIAALAVLGGLAYYIWRPSAKPAQASRHKPQTVYRTG